MTVGEGENKTLLILYGSQTGQAKAIAEEIYARCSRELDLPDNSIDAQLWSLDTVDKKFSFEKSNRIVLVISTTGEGEPPDNALKFWRRVRKKTLPTDHFAHIQYGLLGLGDSNYNRFANFSKDVDTRLQQLGAKHFIEPGFGDDAVGLEIGVEPWLERLILVLPKLFGIVDYCPVPKLTNTAVITNAMENSVEPSLVVSTPSLAALSELSLPLVSSKINSITVTFAENMDDGSKLIFGKSPVAETNVADYEVVAIRSLVNEDAVVAEMKQVLEIEVQATSGQSLPNFVAGDSYGFIPGNSDEEVRIILENSGLAGKATSVCTIEAKGLPHLPQSATLFNLVKFYLEIRSVPKKSALRHLGDYCSEEADKRRLLELSSREGADDYGKFVRNQNVNFLDILRNFKSCRPSLEALLVNVPGFVPRYYSVINHPVINDKSSPTIAKFAMTVINHEPILGRSGSQLFGIFTGLVDQAFRDSQSTNGEAMDQQLGNLTLNSKIYLSLKGFKRKNVHFRLPEDHLTRPLIMVGPGTGVAPFIGFLEQREMTKVKESSSSVGETWLFFGCRNRNHDFIYEQRLRKFEECGVLNQLKVCCSRENGQKTKENEESKDAEPRYVQDLIRKQSLDLAKLIKNDKTLIYVCGDVKMMSVNVFNAFVAVLEDQLNMMHEPAIKLLRDMQADKRYLQDVWI